VQERCVHSALLRHYAVRFVAFFFVLVSTQARLELYMFMQRHGLLSFPCSTACTLTRIFVFLGRQERLGTWK